MDTKLKASDNETEAFSKSAISLSIAGLVAVVSTNTYTILQTNAKFSLRTGIGETNLSESQLSFLSLIEPYQQESFTEQVQLLMTHQAEEDTFVIFNVRMVTGRYVPFFVYFTIFLSELPNPNLIQVQLLPAPDAHMEPFGSSSSLGLFMEQLKDKTFGTYEWVVGTEHLMCSDGLYKIFEIEKEANSYKSGILRDLVHPDDLKQLRTLCTEAVVTGGSTSFTYRIITTSGHLKLVHLLAKAVVDTNGRTVKLVGSLSDITHERQIEADLHRKVEELNRNNRELEDFAYVASHDMQEPLRKITTFSGRLSEKYGSQLSGEGAMFLSRITASAENMRSLINDLLEFSRITKSSQAFEKASLQAILDQVRAELELVIEETGTTITSDPMPEMEVIPSQIKQLFANIISNAIKFRKADELPKIKLSAERLKAADAESLGLKKNVKYYMFKVADNGIGFEMEYAQRIFQVFQRLHGRSEYQGTGVGLAICKKILEYHGGIIFAEGTPGVGAVFTFVMPLFQPKVLL